MTLSEKTDRVVRKVLRLLRQGLTMEEAIRRVQAGMTETGTGGGRTGP